MTETGRTYVHAPATALRGSRDYVHSTDLYEQICAGAKAAGLAFEGPVNLRIRRKITRRAQYVFAPAADAGSLSDTAANALFQSRGEAWSVGVTEADEAITQTRPYDETPAIRNALLTDRQATLTAPTGLRPIEAVTALAVHLHKTVFPPSADRRWMLGQVLLDRPLRDADSQTLTIAIEQTVGGAMTRSRLVGEDGAFGKLVFILG